MLRIPILLCFFFIAVHSKVTPSPNFNLTDFSGTWNLIGLYGLKLQNMASYSCATLDVTIKGAVNFVTLNESWIESSTNSFVNKFGTFVPSPLDNAILISTVSPTAEDNFVVVYYNMTTRQAILINQAATAAFVLSGNDSYNDAHMFFVITASSVLTQADIDFNSVLEVSHYNCNYGRFIPLAGFNISSIIGKKYYANVAFIQQEVSDNNDLCSTVEFDADGDFLSLNYTKGKTDQFDNETVLPYPGLPAILIDTEIAYSNPLIITYQDTENDVILVFRNPIGIGLSTQTSMKPVIAKNIIQALESQGFVVNTSNFVTLPSSCYQNNGFLVQSYVM